VADKQTNTYDWASTEFVQKHARAAAEHITDRFLNFVSSWYARSALESPLEVAFEIWWRAAILVGDAPSVELVRQKEVAIDGRTYRLDFAVEPESPLQVRARAAGVAWPRVCIELDGHEFHERTKEQVAYRNQRDRDLQSDGWMVLHFSGSEMHRDPMACIRAVAVQSRKAFGWEWEEVIFAAEDAKAVTR